LEDILNVKNLPERSDACAVFEKIPKKWRLEKSGTWRYTRGPDIWVAHEIMHSLDPTGMGWDGNGRLSDIWDTPTASR
jgi:hypothetical protein